MTGSSHTDHPVTPDGRYMIVRGRLWRRSDPALSDDERERRVGVLMTARRSVGTALRSGDTDALRAARAQVDDAKRSLGERGPVWWSAGSPDLNRHLFPTTPYADWFACLTADRKER